MRRAGFGIFWKVGITALGLALQAQAKAGIIPLSSPQLWQRLEFRVAEVPATSNPFDPEVISVDARFTLPSGKEMSVPAFWYQAYERALSGGKETVTPKGAPEWRVRFTPSEAGNYRVSLSTRTNGQLFGPVITTSFLVPAAALPSGSGCVKVAPGKQYFETGDGQALRLVGQNVCWHHERGTYDYDDWFAAMQAAGENYARLWMWPSAFGLETEPTALARYRLDHAWQLDYVFQLAEKRGIYLLLCLDYHGMFETKPDFWGGNDYWPNNPYNVTNGGPCLNQNGFFTNSTAQKIYQKRLRYLIARYGASPNLLAWQFFNEIDNVYSHLRPSDVAAWHGIMGAWLHANDPFGHLVTTSLTGNSDRAEIWTLPQLDFSDYHSYGEANPAVRLNAVAQSFLRRYGKPVLIDEFGTDFRGWNRNNDPYLRGFRQGIWGGALGGSVGTTMPWWWESIHREKVYSVYSALAGILKPTEWGRGVWTNVVFRTAGPAPTTVGELVPGGQAFDVLLPLSQQWGGKPSGQLAIPNASAATCGVSALNGFVHGTDHSDMRVPFRLSAWFTNDARMVLHLNSVSRGASLVVRAAGAELFRTNLPNLDGGSALKNEYNLDIPVSVPAGKQQLEVANAGEDWFCLDWVRLERVLPAKYVTDWRPSPDAIGLRGSRESLLYVVAPGLSFPANATNAPVSLRTQHGQTVVLSGWPEGDFSADWYDPATGARVGNTRGTTTNGALTLPLPEFREDLAGVVRRWP